MELQENNLDEVLATHIDPKFIKEFNRIYYGREDHCEMELKKSTLEESKKNNYEVKGYRFEAAIEQTRKPKIVKVGLIQHSIVLPTDSLIEDQREAIFKKVEKIIRTAASEGVNVVCLQETWYMPFFLCTREKEQWAEFAESSVDGPSVTFLRNIAKELALVIISPILENDEGVWWNTAVVIDERGEILGKHRKNHLPSVGSFSEVSYYAPGNLGHPVFDTKYGKVAVNICYGRHQALNWLMFGVNGAEIVFNPAATISEFGESFWGIEARNGAVANSYYTCSINRVGTEVFGSEKKVTRTYYGSNYATSPDGVRTPTLSREKDGLLIVEMDLNLCRQVKDKWSFTMTARLEMYAKELADLQKQKEDEKS